MKITLIRPPYVIPLKSIYGHKGVPSLGLAYLSAALKAENHDVSCLDAFVQKMDQFLPIDGSHLLTNGMSIEEIIENIPRDSKLIGISCMFSNEWINTSRLIKAIKMNFPDSFIVLGGEHVTADYEYILKNYPEVNFCILGEGEEKIKNLSRHLREGTYDVQKIEGVTYFDKDSNTVITNDFPFRIKDINSIPTPDWDALALTAFLDKGMGMSMQGKRTVPMLLSRGCPYRCTFCSNEKMWTTKWVARDIESVILEMKSYILKFRVNHIDFYDLTAVVNKTWTKSFCERLISENLNVTWSLPSGTRSEALDSDVLHLLQKCGCTKITYAPESGSVRMSKLIKKNVNLDKMLRSMRFAVKNGMTVKANIIFGFPDERYRDVLWNFWYIFKMALIGIHDVPCFGFTPYPGSELFNRLLSSGRIKRDDQYYYFLANLVYTSPLDRKSWNKFPNLLMPILSLGGMAFFYTLQYLFRPWRFFKLIYNVKNNQPQTMLEIAFKNMIEDFWYKRRFAYEK